MSNSIIQKMLEVAASYDGTKYVLGSDGSREGGQTVVNLFKTVPMVPVFLGIVVMCLI